MAFSDLFSPESDTRSDSRDADARWAEFQRALAVLRRRVQGNGASDLVLPDLLEDDLRQARIALLRVSDYLDEALSTLGDPRASPSELLSAADTTYALEAVDRLAESLPQVRRRLGQVALRLTRR